MYLYSLFLVHEAKGEKQFDKRNDYRYTFP